MHLPQVSPHEFTSRFWATPLDCLKNSFMVKLAPFRTTVNTKNLETLLAQQADDRVQ
jgi:hypothetical protein